MPDFAAATIVQPWYEIWSEASRRRLDTFSSEAAARDHRRLLVMICPEVGEALVIIRRDGDGIGHLLDDEVPTERHP